MTGYTKLFSSIVMSSIWEESAETRLVWVTMLALADQSGHVDGTVKSLARVSRVPLNACKKALSCLLGPDEHDRSGVMNGERIIVEHGGWRLVNHGAYRAKMSADERRQRDKIRKRESRVSARSPQPSANVRDVSQAEAEAKADQKQNRTEAEQKQEERAAVTRDVTADTRSASIVSPADYEKLQKHNAYVGARLRVPHKLHSDFIAALGGQEPDTVLRGWYAIVDYEIELSGEAIVPSVWKWLDARFKQWAVSTVVDDMEAKRALDRVEEKARHAERERRQAEWDARKAK